MLKSRVEIECPLCQNNPSSTIKWLFNESPLDRKDIEKYYFWCDKRIIVQIRHERDVGNYTCVVKNRFGSGRATTQVVMAYGKRGFADVLLSYLNRVSYLSVFDSLASFLRYFSFFDMQITHMQWCNDVLENVIYLCYHKTKLRHYVIAWRHCICVICISKKLKYLKNEARESKTER